jgi:hypothetical protein
VEGIVSRARLIPSDSATAVGKGGSDERRKSQWPLAHLVRLLSRVNLAIFPSELTIFQVMRGGFADMAKGGLGAGGAPLWEKLLTSSAYGARGCWS